MDATLNFIGSEPVKVFGGYPKESSKKRVTATLGYPDVFDWWKLINPPLKESVFPIAAVSMTSSGSPNAFFISLERTSDDILDTEMAQLQAVAEIGNEQAFTDVINIIDWSNRQPEDFIRAVRLALKSGAHLKARWLATEGATRYPEYTELQNYAQLLAPPKVISANLPPDPNAAADMHWLKTCGAYYRGRWVALRGGVLITTALSWKELLAKLENPKDKSILITPVY